MMRSPAKKKQQGRNTAGQGPQKVGVTFLPGRFVAEPQQMKSTRKPSFLRRKMHRQNRRFCA
jgi:hypothetical protein